MLFQSRKSLRYLGGLGYDITLMEISYRVSIQGNERADVLANEESISGILFQDQAGLITVNTFDIYTRGRTRLLTEWEKKMSRYCYSIISRVSITAWMASTVDISVFLFAISWLASNQTGPICKG
jgi:hypothetical protein